MINKNTIKMLININPLHKFILFVGVRVILVKYFALSY
ncbi:hypothetical protein YPPY32_3200 [Yersinia pestis PY-32]|nr:hypothetical protein YPPY14_2881 [Yersinia pestis PY-14]EIR76438.1 hypothetical protein YPPY32_3200 [Yersinia pestis PY-32]EIS94217.1 hypothetical protein YPPY89_3141 [Yersinia pestis PY-89]EIT54917.1 hypothetical protein YPPY102_2935 [Yersinia pestis PY-102]